MGKTCMEQLEFEQSAKSLRQRIVATARHYGASAETSEDVAQDVMLKLWLLRKKLKDPQAATALAVVAARHRCIDIARTEHKNSYSSLSYYNPPVADTPETLLAGKENLKWLEEKMRLLPPKELTILKLRQVECKEISEIAAIMGIETTSVSTMLSRARRKILEDFKKRNR